MSGGGALDSQFSDCVVGSSGDYGLGFTLLGETVTYKLLNDPGTPPTTSSITAVRVPTSDLFEPEESEQTGWTVSAADVSNPREGDTITDDEGEEWTVLRTAPENGGVFALICQKAKEN